MKQQRKKLTVLLPESFSYSFFHRCIQLVMILIIPVILSGCHLFKDDDKFEPPVVQVPAQFKIEKVVGGLQLPTSVTWDKEVNM